MNLPRICFTGQTNTGKSQIIESLLGLDFLPRGEEANTKRPIEIHLINVDNKNQITTYAEFPYEDGLVGKKIIDFNSIRITISDIIKKKCGVNPTSISKDAIRINIYSNSVPDITIIDLPGLNQEIKLTKEIIYDYLREDCIIVYVASPNEDGFNIIRDPTFKIIQEIDNKLSRTIGVITKIDQINQTNHNYTNILNDIKQVLLNERSEESYLKYGYVGVKNRSNADNTFEIKDILHREKEYFNSHQFFKYVYSSNNDSLFTIDTLADKIKKSIYETSSVRKKLIQISQELKNKLNWCQEELTTFGTDYIAYTNDTKNTYATSLVNQFCETVDRMLNGKMPNIKDNETNHALKSTYIEFLKDYTGRSGYSPSSNLNNEEIIKIIKLTEGDRLSGFPESEVIYSLLEDQLDNLRDQIKMYLDRVNELTSSVIKIAIIRIFCRFPKLLEKIEELMNSFVDKVSLLIL